MISVERLGNKILDFLLLCLVVLMPLAEVLGYGLHTSNGGFVSVLQVVAASFCVLLFCFMVFLRFNVYLDLRWAAGFLLFIIFAIFSIIISPYGNAILSKALIQLVGLVVMWTVGMYVIHVLHQRPSFLLTILNLAKIVLFLLAFVGILQFFYVNITRSIGIFDFRFFNSIAHKEVWRLLPLSSHVYRAYSFATEPAHFVAILSFGLGLALIRLGVIGVGAKTSIKEVVPLWWSLVIVLAVLTSVSLLGYMILGIVFVFLLILARQFFLLYLILLITLILAVVSSVFFCVFFPNSFLVVKIATIPLIFQSAITSSLGVVPNLGVSALALGSNMFVMFSVVARYIFGVGLGGNMAAYLNFAPDYVHVVHGLYLLNASDSCSLLLRLIIETGVIGTLVYLLWVFSLFLRAYRCVAMRISIVTNIKNQVYVAILQGIFASTVALFVYYLVRMGTYYDFEYWLMLALVASIPYLISNKSTQERS